MVYKCDAAGCSNTSSSTITLFKFPKDPKQRQEWEKQVLRTRCQWKANDHSHLCSQHFTADCLEAESTLAGQFGIKRRRRLKPGAIPTIFPRCPASAVADRKRPLLTEETAAPKRSAVEKRQRRQVFLITQKISVLISLDFSCSWFLMHYKMLATCLVPLVLNLIANW